MLGTIPLFIAKDAMKKWKPKTLKSDQKRNESYSEIAATAALVDYKSTNQCY